MDLIAFNHILDYLAAMGIGIFALFVMFARKKSTVELAWAILLLAVSALFFSHSAAWQNGTSFLLQSSLNQFEFLKSLSTLIFTTEYSIRQSTYPVLPTTYTLVPVLALVVNYGVANYYFDAKNFSLAAFALQLIFILAVSSVTAGFLFLGGVAILTKLQFTTAAVILTMSMLCFLPLYKMLRLNRLM